jgi:alkanesulfonate monooxygenase SsuD/methylene tetrahydromethanopterin reductase-like flavin-dependent oxidoreductase (luciferase family)
MERPFRFGVLGESIRTGAELTDTARRAEGFGYSTLLLRDHLVAEPFGHQLAPLVALAAAAAATTTLRIGTLVLANDYRHPALLAKEAATLDVLSDGRFELGLGAGWLSDEYRRAGMASIRPPSASVASPNRCAYSSSCSAASRRRRTVITSRSPTWPASPYLSSSRTRHCSSVPAAHGCSA